MESTASHPRLSRPRLASPPRCKSGRSRCRPLQNHKRSLHRNQQYSITAVTDGSGAVVERYAYTAYGTPTITDASGTPRTTTAVGNRYTYTGREWDEALSLYHYRARMYDPVSGRFVSRDPIGYVDGFSLYRSYFVPHGVDPTGLDWHHLLPWKWGEIFGQLGFDINSTTWGWVLDAEVHSQLESAGWGREWDEFFHDFDNGGPRPTPAMVEQQFVEMVNDPRFSALLEKGTRATTRYPYELEREGWENIIDGLDKIKKGTKLKSLLAAVGIASMLYSPVHAACGGCEDERENLRIWVRAYGRNPTQMNCQEVASELRNLLQCVGTDDATNGLQYIITMTRFCAELP